MATFLCVVINRNTKETLKEYPNVVAENFYYARHKVAKIFEKEEVELAQQDWCVDSLEIDE